MTVWTSAPWRTRNMTPAELVIERLRALDAALDEADAAPRSARTGTLLPSARPLPVDRHPFLADPTSAWSAIRCGTCGYSFTRNAAHFDGATPVASPDVTEPATTPTGTARVFTVADLQRAEPVCWPADKPAAGRNFDPYARHDEPDRMAEGFRDNPARTTLRPLAEPKP